jgi:hypothetical protein
VSVQIIEFRRLLDGGRRYLDGACLIQELNGLAVQCLDASKFWHGHPALVRAAQDWAAMVDGGMSAVIPRAQLTNIALENGCGVNWSMWKAKS